MQDYAITLEEKPSDDDCRFLGKSLYEFNVAQSGLEVKHVGAFLRDSERHIVGGILGWTVLDLLHINILWVRDDARGQGYGKRLLLTAEHEAIERGCRHAQLETLSSQAPDFYRKQGYRVFGQFVARLELGSCGPAEAIDLGLRRSEHFTIKRGQMPDESIDERVEVSIEC